MLHCLRLMSVGMIDVTRCLEAALIDTQHVVRTDMKRLTVLDLFLSSDACDTPNSSVVCTSSCMSAMLVFCSCHLCTVSGL